MKIFYFSGIVQRAHVESTKKKKKRITNFKGILNYVKFSKSYEL
jgi:uncharacterized membrane protein